MQKIQPRLRMERVVVRRKKAVTVNGEAVGTSVKDEAIATQRAHVAKMNGHQVDGEAHNLLQLFNVHRVEFAKLVSGGRYIPCEWPKQATHRLVPTSWNTEPDKTHMPKTFALSVCAVPMRPKIRQASVEIRKCIPKQVPTYKVDGRVEGKHAVLRFIVIATKAKVPLKAIPKLSSVECDILYQNIVRASRRKKLRKLLGD